MKSVCTLICHVCYTLRYWRKTTGKYQNDGCIFIAAFSDNNHSNMRVFTYLFWKMSVIRQFYTHFLTSLTK